MCTKFTSFQFVLAVPTIIIFSSFYKSANAVTFGLGNNNNFNYNRQNVNYYSSRSPEPHDFFSMLSRVQLTFRDIEAMYRNVSSTASTKNCQLCRTPVALWVINSLATCHDITKADCPLGLVCCHFPPSTVVIQDNNLKRSDDLDSAASYEFNEEEFDPFSFKQDPIPGDSY